MAELSGAASHHANPMAGGEPVAPDDPALHPLPEMLHRLATRRSVPMRAFADTAIRASDLDTLLTLAARTPDHGGLVPWRFIVLEGDARRRAGEKLDALYAAQRPELDAAKRDMWTLYLLRAPVTVILVSRKDPTSKVPEWDQVLGAGAAGMSLVVAATALGYATQWLLKWPGRDPDASALLGVGPTERVAGFLHVGRPTERPADRLRPAFAAIVTRWTG